MNLTVALSSTIRFKLKDSGSSGAFSLRPAAGGGAMPLKFIVHWPFGSLLPKTVPPTLKYFLEIVDILKGMKAENLTSKSILTGPPQKIIDDLKAVEKGGISEVILYFNYGLKPNEMVIEQMERFAAEVAPAFASGSMRAAE